MNYRNKIKSCQFYSASNSNHQPNLDYLKYLVVDSENQDEQIYRRETETIQSTPNISNTPILASTPNVLSNNNSRITKHKNINLSNFTSNQVSHQDSHSNIDGEIRKAETEVNSLEKECMLLEKLIGDMTRQQAQLKIGLRIRERGSVQKRQSCLPIKRDCPVHHHNKHNHQQSLSSINSSQKAISSAKIIKPKEAPFIPEVIEMSVLLSKEFSQNRPEIKSKGLKASSIRTSTAKPKKNTQNIAPLKKQPWDANFRKKKKQTRSNSIVASTPNKVKRPL